MIAWEADISAERSKVEGERVAWTNKNIYSRAEKANLEVEQFKWEEKNHNGEQEFYPKEDLKIRRFPQSSRLKAFLSMCRLPPYVNQQ